MSNLRNSELILDMHKLVKELNNHNSKPKVFKIKLTPQLNQELVDFLTEKINDEYKKPLNESILRNK